jgi:glycosidase
MPDLNQSNPLVLNYLKQNAIWWIEYADLDGFRVDTYNYSDPPELHLGQKQSQTSTQISILWAKSGCQAQMAYWQKTVKLVL